MKLSFVLSEPGLAPEVIRTNCCVTLQDEIIESAHLDVRAKVPGITSPQFEEYASQARTACPVSKALRITTTLTACLIDELVPEPSSV
jgi:osmotically inducible protein OsmC